MIKITDSIWVGDSDDEKYVVKRLLRGQDVAVDGVLVVAHDMDPTGSCQLGVEYMHVGLIDGPGNPLSAYHAAVLALAALLKRGKVLVCCHDGGRALAIVIMYLYLIGDGPSWDECIDRMRDNYAPEVLLPVVHGSHKKAFFMMDWGMMKRVLERVI